MNGREPFAAGRAVAILVALVLAPAFLPAQTPPGQPPANIVLPNYDSIPIGQLGGFEAGAFVARANDDSSNWYNPAGLSRAETSSISSAAGTYQLLSLDPTALQDTGGNTQQVPAALGILVKSPFGGDKANASLLLVRTNSWEQETEAEIDTLSDGSGRLSTYSADSRFSRVEGSLGVSYNAGGPWRFGVALSGVYTYLRAIQSSSERIVGPDTLVSAQVAGRATGSTGHARLAVGAQYDLTPEIRLGALLRSPGLLVIRDGQYNIDGLANAGAATGSFTFFDKDIRFDNKLPAQLVLGAAWVRDRFQIELDVKAYSGISKYDLFRTTKQAVTITSDGQGGPTVVGTQPVENIVSASKALVNVAIGGQVDLSGNKAWKLHFGANTDLSPVASEDQFFTKVNLYALTLAVSGETRHIVGSLGFQYTFGNADVPLRIAGNETTKLKMHALGILYSLSYRF